MWRFRLMLWQLRSRNYWRSLAVDASNTVLRMRGTPHLDQWSYATCRGCGGALRNHLRCCN